MHKNTEYLELSFAVIPYVVELFYIEWIVSDHPMINGVSFSINLN